MEITQPNTTLEELINMFGGHGSLKLDLGCGFYKPHGFIGLDNLEGARVQTENLANLPDIMIDLHNEPLPFREESVIEVRTSHYLEHSNLDFTFQEVNRVLSLDGRFVNTIPYALSDDGLYPGHSIFLTEKWFHENITFQKYFEIESITYRESNEYKAWPKIVKLLIPFNWARRHLMNVCIEMTFVARKR